MTDTPKSRSREEQKADLAHRLGGWSGASNASREAAEEIIAEAEARERVAQGGEPVAFMCESAFPSKDAPKYRRALYFIETPNPVPGLIRNRVYLYAHPDPLLAAKDAEIVALRAELARLRKPEWFADPDDPEDGGLDIDEILDNRGESEGEIVVLDGYRRTGTVWAFRLNKRYYQFDTEAEAVSALASMEQDHD